MKSAVLVFPGSNCDRDLAVAIQGVTGKAPAMVWHRETELPEGTGLIAIPGGFSYGDYLRSGAMAARSPTDARVPSGQSNSRSSIRPSSPASATFMRAKRSTWLACRRGCPHG